MYRVFCSLFLCDGENRLFLFSFFVAAESVLMYVYCLGCIMDFKYLV